MTIEDRMQAMFDKLFYEHPEMELRYLDSLAWLETHGCRLTPEEEAEKQRLLRIQAAIDAKSDASKP